MKHSARCKICNSELRVEIEKLMTDNNSSTYVEKWCSDHNFLVTSSSILRHMYNHYEGTFYTDKSNNKQESSKILSADEENKKLPCILLKDYLKKYNISESKIKSLKNISDYEELYGNYQRMISELIIENMFIIKKDFERNINLEGKFPEDKIKSLKILIDINEKINPTNISLNINRAVELLINEGYTINDK